MPETNLTVLILNTDLKSLISLHFLYLTNFQEKNELRNSDNFKNFIVNNIIFKY